MLGKLFKYEIKATARTFLPLFAGLLAFSVFNRFFYYGSIGDMMLNLGWMGNFIYGLVGFLYGGLILAMFVVAITVIIQRFYKNLLGDEGYLMLTLPAKPWQHITGKMLTGGIWAVSSVVVAFTAMLLMTSDANDIAEFFSALREGIMVTAQEFHIPAAVLILELVLWCAFTVFNSVLLIYCCISLGHLFRRHRVAGSVLAFAGISVITQFFSSGIQKAAFGNDVFNLFFQPYRGMGVSVTQVHHFILLSIALAAFYCIVYFVITNFVLSKRLNLE